MTIKPGELRSGKGHRDENFPVASRLIHPRHRGIILAFYEFVRTADDMAKVCKIDPDERRQLLNHVASDVQQASYSNNPDPEVLRPAVESIAQWVLEQQCIAESKFQHHAGAGISTRASRDRGEIHSAAASVKAGTP